MADRIKSLGLGPELHAYLVGHGTKPDAVQQRLIEETRKLGVVAGMQVAPEQGAFLTILTRALGVRHALEVGTFTGYSALCIARGLPDDGQLVCLDVNEEWTSLGRRAWDEAGVGERIELVLGPAGDTLGAMPEAERFDLAFIDADKGGYQTYVDEIHPRLRTGGLILVDNVLWSGRVIDPAADDENTRAIRAFNDRACADPRFDCVMLPISDGLTMLRKR